LSPASNYPLTPELGVALDPGDKHRDDSRQRLQEYQM